MSIRKMIFTTGLFVGLLANSTVLNEVGYADAVHIPATSEKSPAFSVPSDKRVPFGWPSIAIAPADEETATFVQWSGQELPPGDNVQLRVATALDSHEPLLLEIRVPSDPEPLGNIKLNFSPVFQIGELALTRDQASRVLAEGILITRTVGNAPFHLFGPSASSSTSDIPDIPAVLQPHLMVAGETDRWAEYMKRLEGVDTVQPFGWMEGAILDGVYELAEVSNNEQLTHALSERIDLYLHGDQLVYEDPKSVPCDNRVFGIEDSLPFAVIARTRPDHPTIQLAIDFWKDKRRSSGFAEGCIQDGGLCSAEGSYTVGYPLMLIGRLRNDPQLVEMALDQFRIRKTLLVEDGDLWLRNSNGRRHMKNWARGVTWYFLGLVRGIAEAPEGTDTNDLRAEAIRTMDWVLQHQQHNGLWRNLFDLPSQTVDTSGSAGIAAALAIGASEGILPERARTAALKTKNGLTNFLTPDGLLAHGTPSNRSPEAQSNRRVIFPVGMGLTAQLIAALAKEALKRN